MKSLPKKRAAPLDRCACIPNITIPGTPSTHSSTLPPSPQIPKIIHCTDFSVMDNKFAQIQAEINKQHLHNAAVDALISSLENTTQTIDSKIDRILDRIESTLPSSHKIQKTLNNSNFEMASPPESHFHSTDNMGHSLQCHRWILLPSLPWDPLLVLAITIPFLPPN